MSSLDPNWHDSYASAEKAMLSADYDFASIELKKLLEITDVEDEAYIQVLEKLAEAQWYLDKLDDSDKSCRILTVIWKEQENQAGLVAALSNLAIINDSLEKHSEAEFLYIEAMKEMRILLGPNHPYIAKIKGFYAHMLKSLGRDEEVMELGAQPRDITTLDWHSSSVITMFKKKLESNENEAKPSNKSKEKEDIQITISTNESRMLFNSNRQMIKQAIKSGDLDLAERLWLFNLRLLDAFEVRGTIYDTALDRLSDIKYRQGLIKESALYKRKVYDNKIQSKGSDDIQVALAGEQLARLYYELAEYNTCEELLNKSIRIYKLANGEEHSTVACALHNLATLLHVQNEFERAEQAYKQSLELKLKVFGEDHNETKRLLKSYSNLLTITGRQEEAQKITPETTGMITGSWSLDGKSAKTSISDIYDDE